MFGRSLHGFTATDLKCDGAGCASSKGAFNIPVMIGKATTHAPAVISAAVRRRVNSRDLQLVIISSIRCLISHPVTPDPIIQGERAYNLHTAKSPSAYTRGSVPLRRTSS